MINFNADKKSEHAVDIGLRAWTNGIDTFAAYSADDAILLACELSGNDANDMCEDEKDFVLAEKQGTDIAKVFDEDAGKTVEKSVAEWIEITGRGLLWSTEW